MHARAGFWAFHIGKKVLCRGTSNTIKKLTLHHSSPAQPLLLLFFIYLIVIFNVGFTT
jgi:hypothetical protein